MPNFPGSTGALPGVVTDVVTLSGGVSIPGGSRIAAIIGEGSTDEVIVSQASGGGVDGLNSSYTSTSGADGRHFKISSVPVISNRTTLFKNGVALAGLEETPDSNSFSNQYDYRIDITTGQIELQSAHLVDQGGAYYVPLTTNVGDGYLSGLTLEDNNAPPETWTIRCVSVQRDPSNNPIASTAKFIAIGSVSGSKLDGYGNPVVWVANGETVSNGVLSFAVYETKVGPVTTSPFVEGDGFTVKVDSGVLVRGDSLTANYIPEAVLNDPVLLQGMDDVVARHGQPSTTNTLSLGAQLAFANNAPAIYGVQAAPPMPRRTSYSLSDYVKSSSTNDDDFIFPLPLGVTPDYNTNIHFFVKDNSTNVEQQILPNKLTYYTLDTVGYPTTNSFITDNTLAPSGYSYYYTVIQDYAVMASGYDGYIGRNLAFTHKGVFSCGTTFNQDYIGKKLKVIDADNVANTGEYTITAVSDGKLYVTHDTFGDFTSGSAITFSVVDTAGTVLATNTDGVLTNVPSSETATFSSAAVNFTAISSITSRRLLISGTSSNDGLYDITAVDMSDNLTIAKAVVNESSMRFEVLDTSSTSEYIVINKNVVPEGYALRVTLIDDKDASFYDTGWASALESLETIECDIVVPLPSQTISAIFQNALSHCRYMSNSMNKKERVLFCGAINGLAPANVIGTKQAAVEDIGVLEGIQGETVTDVLSGNIEDLANYSVSDAFGNTYRCVYFYPDQIVVSVGGENTLLDGFYLAAAAAGYLSASIRIEEPLTNKSLTGFAILRNKQFSPLVLQQLAAAGICVAQPVAGGGRVLWGITTTQSGYPEEQEISIVFIRDRIAKDMRTGFQGYIGTAETEDTPAVLHTRVVQLLTSFIGRRLITKYDKLVVKRDDVDPRQWNIAVAVMPTYGINWIYIKISVGTL